MASSRDTRVLYDRLISALFWRHYEDSADQFEFEREEFNDILSEWGERVKNLGDVAYSYRGGRRYLPDDISNSGNWVIG